MKIETILKKYMISILRKSPATLDFVMDCCTDVILENSEKNFDEAIAEAVAEEMKLFIVGANS